MDYLIDDYKSLSVLPLEIKSGKDYTVHSALDKFLATPEYHVNKAMVLSNGQQVYVKNGITYLPIYYCMFLENNKVDNKEEMVIPQIEMPS